MRRAMLAPKSDARTSAGPLRFSTISRRQGVPDADLADRGHAVRSSPLLGRRGAVTLLVSMRRRLASPLPLLSSLIASALPSAALPGGCGGLSASSARDGGLMTEAGGSGGDDATNGGSSGGHDANDDSETGSSCGSSTGSSSSCVPNTTTMMYPVDPSVCAPQVSFVEGTCTFVCQRNIVLACAPYSPVEAGADAEADAGTDAGDPCAVCALFSDAGPTSCSVMANYAPDSGTLIQCGSCCINGRAPRGFAPSPSHAPSARAERLAAMAQLEAASVDAFHALHADLVALGAPRRLLASVRAAARDEIRHARDMGRAAARFGAKVPAARVDPAPARTLEQLAIENAEEGCVRETFGAALAALQATTASDQELRRLLRTIAREELRHASLAWRIARWLDGRLDAAGRARVSRARQTALAALDGELARDVADQVLGLPAPSATRALLARMRPAIASGNLAMTG